MTDRPAPVSQVSNLGVELLFQNQTQRSFKLVWLDEAGKRHAPVMLPGASRHLLKTFEGHTWLLLDENNQGAGHVVASGHPARVIIQE